MNYDLAGYILDTAVPWMGGHGVEYIHSRQDTPRFVQGLSYVNMGDPHIETLIFDHATGQLFSGNWGVIVEEDPGRFDLERGDIVATMLALLREAAPMLDDHYGNAVSAGYESEPVRQLIERINSVILAAESAN